MKKYIVLLFLILINYSFAQSKLEIFPGQLNIQPFAANTLEPKLGSIFKIGKNQLELNIGSSSDILHYQKSENETLSFGADLFTYTLLRGEHYFHFPVDAVDYLFGINGGYKNIIDNDHEYGARLRLSHISAHFADGHYEGAFQRWRDNENPRVYSREFFELMSYYRINTFRIYGGLTYIIHTTPSEIKKDNYQLGFDYYFKNSISEYLIPFAGYDLKVIHLDKYSVNHSVILGIKFGRLYGKGLTAFFTYYSGKSYHGEYYDYNSEYSAIGINMDL